MGRNWAIAIGINHYDNLPPLSYAQRDAIAMRDYFLNEAGFEKVYYFAEDAPDIELDYGPPFKPLPTYTKLDRFLDIRFEKQDFLGPGDNFWFFFAGHGKRHQNRDYLLPSDVNPRNLERTAIPITTLTERLCRCGADNVILLLDACRNEGDRDGEGIGIEKQKGVVTLFSCSPSERSYEIDELQQGSFTHTLLQGLRIHGEGNCATVERLDQHLRYRVPEVNRRYNKPCQTPSTNADPIGKCHLILLPQKATLADVMVLKNDALEAEAERDWDLAEQLWIRVLVASPADRQAIRAIKRIAKSGDILTSFQEDLPLQSISSREFTSTAMVVEQQENVPSLPLIDENKEIDIPSVDFPLEHASPTALEDILIKDSTAPVIEPVPPPNWLRSEPIKYSLPENDSFSNLGSLGARSTSLNDWIYQRVNVPHVQVRSRLRGSTLHLLFEGTPCPDRAIIVPPLTEALSVTALTMLLPPQSSPVERVIVYGRRSQQSTPEWIESFIPHLNEQLSSEGLCEEISPQALSEAASGSPQSPQVYKIESTTHISVLSAARLGNPDAIAHYLSDAFSMLGIAIRVRLENKRSFLSSIFRPRSSLSPQHLLISFESACSHDLLSLAEPIAQHLRALELSEFQDAIVFGKVAGETKPEWALRVDLTPPNDILEAWARWGDAEAITRLLNRVLLPEKVQVTALLKDATLHLTCRSTQSATPDKLTTITTIVPMLEALAPQGICKTNIYGFAQQDGPVDLLSTAATPTPVWVHWLDLSSDPQPLSTLDLAQKGNLDAIAFLLERMLNPDLDRKLGTGGIWVQVRQKADLLHIMGEAPICPLQSQMGTAIARFLEPLQIPAITGVRIYGRRAGQKQPVWSYGVDFVRRG